MQRKETDGLNRFCYSINKIDLLAGKINFLLVWSFYGDLSIGFISGTMTTKYMISSEKVLLRK